MLTRNEIAPKSQINHAKIEASSDARLSATKIPHADRLKIPRVNVPFDIYVKAKSKCEQTNLGMQRTLFHFFLRFRNKDGYNLVLQKSCVSWGDGIDHLYTKTETRYDGGVGDIFLHGCDMIKLILLKPFC